MPNGDSGENVATATWNKALYFTPGDTATGNAAFASTTPTTIVNGSVIVTDAQAPNPPLPATVSYTDPSMTTFNYPLSFPGVGGKCTDYDNTAKISYSTPDQAFDSDTETVTVCVGLDLSVTKTATPTFTRTYACDITKDVLGTTVKNISGGMATFD